MNIAINNVASKLFVAFVAAAMLFTLAAPSAKAATADELQAQITALMAQIAALTSSPATGAGSAACTFTRSLTLGSEGSDVNCLQNYLTSTGHFSFSGGSTGYFGGVTASAVAAWQGANGISPAVGYFGPVSQAKYASLMAAAPVVVPPVVTPGTSTSTDDTTTSDLGNDEGSITGLDQVSADESTLEEGKLSGLLAFTATVEGDVEVDRVDVYLDSKMVDAQSDNADDYFQGAVLTVDGEEVATLDVSDFNESSSYDDETNIVAGDTKAYRLRFSGLGLVFADGDEPEFQIALDANSTIDSGDLNETWGLDNPSLRFVDGKGFSDTINDDGVEADFTGATQEMADVSITKSADSMDATTLEVDNVNKSDSYDIFTIDVEEQNGVDVSIDTMTFTLDTTNADVTTTVDEVVLMQGSTELASDRPNAAGVVLFENVGLDVAADETETLTLAVVFRGSDTYAEGDSVTIALTSIDDVNDENGNDEGDLTAEGNISGADGSIESDPFTLRSTGVALALNDESFVLKANSTTDLTDDQGVYTYKFDVTAFGDDFYFEKTAEGLNLTGTTQGAEYVVTTDGGSTIIPTPAVTQSLTSTADTVGARYVVHKGDTETFTLKSTFDPTTSGFYAIRLNNVNYYIVSVAGTEAEQLAVPTSDFLTEEYDI